MTAAAAGAELERGGAADAFLFSAELERGGGADAFLAQRRA